MARRESQGAWGADPRDAVCGGALRLRSPARFGNSYNMGVRQVGPLGLYLHLEEPTFGFPVAPAHRHLVLPVPLAGGNWLASFHTTGTRHLTPRRRPPPPRYHATAAPVLDASLRRSLEREAVNGGLTVPLLRQAMAGVSGPVASRWVEPLNVACRKYEITLRPAHGRLLGTYCA